MFLYVISKVIHIPYLIKLNFFHFNISVFMKTGQFPYTFKNILFIVCNYLTFACGHVSQNFGDKCEQVYNRSDKKLATPAKVLTLERFKLDKSEIWLFV